MKLLHGDEMVHFSTMAQRLEEEIHMIRNQQSNLLHQLNNLHSPTCCLPAVILATIFSAACADLHPFEVIQVQYSAI